MIKGARALNSGKPFPGERMLHWVVDKTYFAHILPPLPEDESTTPEILSQDIGDILNRGGEALRGIGTWVSRFRNNLIDKNKTDKDT